MIWVLSTLAVTVSLTVAFFRSALESSAILLFFTPLLLCRPIRLKLGVALLLALLTLGIFEWSDRETSRRTLSNRATEFADRVEVMSILSRGRGGRTAIVRSTLLDERILLRAESSSIQFHPGDRLEVRCALSPIDVPYAPSGMDWVAYARGLGVSRECRTAHVKRVDSTEPVSVVTGILREISRFKDALLARSACIFNDPAESLVAAALLGEKKELDPELMALFSRLQIAHLFVVSASHFGVIGWILFIMAKLLLAYLYLHTQPNIGLRARWFTVISLIPVGAFFSFDVSVARVLLTMIVSVLLVSQALPLPSLTVFALVVHLSLALNPYDWVHPGWLLSFFSVAALLLIVPRLGRGRAQFLAAPIAVAAVLTPLLSALFPIFSPVGPLWNLIAIPYVSLLLLPFSLLALVGAPFVASGVDGLAAVFVMGCTAADSISLQALAIAPSGRECLIYYIAIGFAVQFPQTWARWVGVGALPFLWLIYFQFSTASPADQVTLYLESSRHSRAVIRWSDEEVDGPILRFSGGRRALHELIIPAMAHVRIRAWERVEIVAARDRTVEAMEELCRLVPVRRIAFVTPTRDRWRKAIADACPAALPLDLPRPARSRTEIERELFPVHTYGSRWSPG